jgi:hypothetical protein
LLTPAAIPDRSCAECVTVNDFNTQELARALLASLHAKTGCFPHVIINRLHRRKLDANREIVEAADGNPLAEQAWNEFHMFMGIARDRLLSEYGRGLFTDIHGHGHAAQRLELGYLVSKNMLQQTDSLLNLPATVMGSSVRNLSEFSLTADSHAALLRGKNALGTLLHSRNYPAVPSLQDPYPGDPDAYFSGGYNTARYGSADGTPIDGIQIECNRTGIRDSISQVIRFADSLALTLLDYLSIHYLGPQPSWCSPPPSGEWPRGIQPPPMQVFPNPACENTLVTLPGDCTALYLYDWQGRLLQFHEPKTDMPFVLPCTQRGTYLVVARLHSGSTLTKMLVVSCP